MAATWPSIIPLGATTSAPASAWARATRSVQLERGVVEHLARRARARHSARGRCTRRGRGRPSAPVRHRRRRAGRAGPPARRRRDPRPHCPARPCARGRRRGSARVCRARPAAWPRHKESSVCWTSPGMRCDGHGGVDALAHEKRCHQIVDAEARLGHQPAERRRAAQPAQAAGRERRPADPCVNAYEAPPEWLTEVVDQLPTMPSAAAPQASKTSPCRRPGPPPPCSGRCTRHGRYRHGRAVGHA